MQDQLVEAKTAFETLMLLIRCLSNQHNELVVGRTCQRLWCLTEAIRDSLTLILLLAYLKGCHYNYMSTWSSVQ